MDNQLPVCEERKNEKRQYESDTLGKLLFIGFCFLKKQSLHSLSTADKISKSDFETVAFGVQSVIGLSDFSLQFYISNQSGTGIFYKLCKNLINTKSQKDCKGHQKKKKKEHDVNFMLPSLLLYTIYNWSFVSSSSFMTTVLHRLKVGDK